MALLPALQAAVAKAVSGDVQGLHQMILGPARSGKTTQAGQYIEALREKGVADGTLSVFASAAEWRDDDWNTISKTFETAKGGILVLDELEKADKTARKFVTREVMRAITDSGTLVIITGAASLTSLLDSEAGLKRRINAPIVLTQPFTEAEREAYRREKEAEENARRMKALAARDAKTRLEEWKAAKDEDLRPRRRFAAPRTAHFKKPQGAK